MQSVSGVTGGPKYLLRAEGLAVLGLVVILFWRCAYSWVLFGVLFFIPDISMVGYFVNPRVGAASYNAAHSYVGPVLLALVGLAADIRTCIAISLIWAAHIGFDRVLGYGLKYPTAFTDTHLGRIGRT
jgi:uncharacterized protein DUF4260